MADRVLTWHLVKQMGNENQVGPAYYMESDYHPHAVRIHAGAAPQLGDARFDIKADGVSIFNSHYDMPFPEAGDSTVHEPDTTIFLPLGEQEEEAAEDFRTDPIVRGSWVTCHVASSQKASDMSIHLELERLNEPNEMED